MFKNKKSLLFIVQALIPFVVITLLFLLLPSIMMIIDSFKSGSGSFTLENYKTSLTNMFYLKAISNSIQISLISSLIGLIIALVCAYSISNFSEKVQNSIITILNMTSNYSGVPLAFGYIVLLGNTGMFVLLFKHFGLNGLNNFNLYSWIGLIITYVYFQIPLAIMVLYPSFLGIKKEWRQSAMLLGANSTQFWTKIGIPVLLPSIVGTLSILFANAMGAYATAYALVGRNYNLLTIRIGALVVGDIMPEPQLAGALAVILGITTISMMIINEKMSKYIKRG
ncbi:ABC transporter permease [Clostridium estertheticum]|uniref:ABC transporter permease n=1 Tax=Clostridium estertheticum TaxID=238834 RepID=UPI0013E90CA5|nr:ABC transporter permease [Clostridium estertheticum]MBZ9685936.1 ABC transporter permease [Clostridium estertheticum]